MHCGLENDFSSPWSLASTLVSEIWELKEQRQRRTQCYSFAGSIQRRNYLKNPLKDFKVEWEISRLKVLAHEKCHDWDYHLNGMPWALILLIAKWLVFIECFQFRNILSTVMLLSIVAITIIYKASTLESKCFTHITSKCFTYITFNH